MRKIYIINIFLILFFCKCNIFSLNLESDSKQAAFFYRQVYSNNNTLFDSEAASNDSLNLKNNPFYYLEQCIKLYKNKEYDTAKEYLLNAKIKSQDNLFIYILIANILWQNEIKDFYYEIFKEIEEQIKNTGYSNIDKIQYYFLSEISPLLEDDANLLDGVKQLEILKKINLKYPYFYKLLANHYFPGSFLKFLDNYTQYWKIKLKYYEYNSQFFCSLFFYLIITFSIFFLLMSILLLFKNFWYFFHLFHHNIEKIFYFLNHNQIKRLSYFIIAIVFVLLFSTLPFLTLFLFLIIWNKLRLKEKIFLSFFAVYIGAIPFILNYMDKLIYVSNPTSSIYQLAYIQDTYPEKKDIDALDNLKDSSNSFIVDFIKALLYKRIGNISEAENIYLNLLEKTDKEPFYDNKFEKAAILNNLGGINIMQGNYKKAIEYLNSAISIDGNIAAIYYNLSVAYNKIFDLKKSSEYHSLASNLDNDLVIFMTNNTTLNINRCIIDIELPSKYFWFYSSKINEVPQYMSYYTLKFFGIKNYYSFSFFLILFFVILLFFNYLLNYNINLDKCPICGNIICNECNKKLKSVFILTTCNSCNERLKNIKMPLIISGTIENIRNSKKNFIKKYISLLCALIPGCYQVFFNRLLYGGIFVFIWINVLMLNFYKFDLFEYHFSFLNLNFEKKILLFFGLLLWGILFVLSMKSAVKLVDDIRFELNFDEVMQEKEEKMRFVEEREDRFEY